MFQNFPNTTRNFAARGILDNFEKSLAVLFPNITTRHGITYTYTYSLVWYILNYNTKERLHHTKRIQGTSMTDYP